MPRAMSSLLQNILAQNPDIHATATDPSFEFIFGARANLATPEAKAMDQDELLAAYHAFCREGWKAYAEKLSKGKTNVCIKHRGIVAHYSIVANILEDKPKVIQMVRDARSIFSSYEKIFRKSQAYPNGIVDNSKLRGTNTAKRVDIWSETPPIGLAFERLHQATLEGIDKHVLFVRAEDLTKTPVEEMKKIYDYLGLPVHQHDFNNVVQVTKEDDDAYGMGVKLHETRLKVEPVKPDYREILGKEISDNINRHYAWYQEKFGYS